MHFTRNNNVNMLLFKSRNPGIGIWSLIIPGFRDLKTVRDPIAIGIALKLQSLFTYSGLSPLNVNSHSQLMRSAKPALSENDRNTQQRRMLVKHKL